jgi:hypothetical protein
MRKFFVTAAMITAVVIGTSRGYSQHWSLGGNMGMSLLNGSGGFHLTPMAELLLNRNMGVGSEFSINTQYGVPLLLHPYFRYYFNIHGSKLRPYVNAGPVLTLNIPNAPYFGILFGGGVAIPIAERLYLAHDMLLGPVFGVGARTYNLFLYGNYYGTGAYGASSYTVPGGTVFAFTIRGGIRYDL